MATTAHTETTAAPDRYRIQAVERVGAILDVFSVEEPELGVTEIAERTGLHKSTAHRFLVNLEAVGLLRTVPQRGLQIAHVDLKLIHNAFALRGLL